MAETVDGERLGEHEAMSLAFLLLAAGLKTTIGVIGGMLYHVAGNAEVRDALLADPSLIPLAVEESLRLEPSLVGLGRTVAVDSTMRGFSMPAVRW